MDSARYVTSAPFGGVERHPGADAPASGNDAYFGTAL